MPVDQKIILTSLGLVYLGLLAAALARNTNAKILEFRRRDAAEEFLRKQRIKALYGILPEDSPSKEQK